MIKNLKNRYEVAMGNDVGADNMHTIVIIAIILVVAIFLFLFRDAIANFIKTATGKVNEMNSQIESNFNTGSIPSR